MSAKELNRETASAEENMRMENEDLYSMQNESSCSAEFSQGCKFCE